MLYRVTARNFVAGVITNKRRVVVKSAPILKWSLGKDISVLQSWCLKKRMVIDRLDDMPEA